MPTFDQVLIDVFRLTCIHSDPATALIMPYLPQPALVLRSIRLPCLVAAHLPAASRLDQRLQ